MSSKAKKRVSPDPRRRIARLLEPEHAAYKSGVFRVAGVDEAGRGPLAGPVVAAAVVFPRVTLKRVPSALLDLNDSKLLTAPRRAALMASLTALPDIRIGVGMVDPPEIDRLNILRATHRAMAEALEALSEMPELALVDGLPVPGLPCRSESMVKGDGRCFSIAAASVIAKETRDRLMKEYDRTYPEYGFARHKGYGTRQHKEALRTLGPCPIHRHSFAPVREWKQLF